MLLPRRQPQARAEPRAASCYHAAARAGGSTGDTRQCGGVSARTVMQAAKSRDYCAGGNGTNAWQGQHDLHLLLGREAPRRPPAGPPAACPTWHCCATGSTRCAESAGPLLGRIRHTQDSGDVGESAPRMLSGRIWEWLTRSGSPSNNKMGAKRLLRSAMSCANKRPCARLIRKSLPVLR